MDTYEQVLIKLSKAVAKIAALEAERDALRKDAERWQLRYETLRVLFPSAPSDEELDIAIDAAIAAKVPKYYWLDGYRSHMRTSWQAARAPQAVPALTGWKLVPIEPTKEMWDAVNKLDDEMAAGSYDGKGCSIEQAWECLLAAAPQPSPEQAAEPVNWYPADSHNPESAHCGCRGCIRELDEKHPIDQIFTREATRMIVCKKCGNKRCPHANDHRNVCAGSNEPGQAGSAYPKYQD